MSDNAHIPEGERFKAVLVGGPRDGARYDLAMPPRWPNHAREPYPAISVPETTGLYHLDGQVDGAFRYVWRNGNEP